MEGQYYLGEMYANGIGVKKDIVEAMKWYELAANQNYSSAQYQLGNMHLSGEDIEQNYAEALKWFKLAAKLGNDEAQSALGFMYCTGNGVARDLVEAEKWVLLTKDSLNTDKPNAAFNLGYLYMEGKCGEKDYKQAIKMYEISAEQGNILAPHFLGYMYAEGLGVTQSTSRAGEWFKKACDNGFKSDCISDE